MTDIAPFLGGPVDLAEPDWEIWTADSLKQRHASTAWRAATEEMRDAGTLSVGVADALRRYGEYAALHREASAHVAEEGAVKARAGKQAPMWNLWLSAMEKIEALLLKIELELGLSPARRAGATPAKRQAKKTVAADAYLGAKSIR